MAATEVIFRFGFKTRTERASPAPVSRRGTPFERRAWNRPPSALRPRCGAHPGLASASTAPFSEMSGKVSLLPPPGAWTEGLPAARRAPCGLCGAKPSGGRRRSPSPALGCRAAERVWKGPHPGLGRRGPPAALGEPPRIPSRLPGGPIPHPPPFVRLSRRGVESGRKKIIRWKSKIKRGALAA